MELRLYVINTEKYKGIIDTVKGLLTNGLSQYHLEIINVLEHPDMAEQDNIIATPTLLNMSTDPPKRVIGNMADKEKILIALSIKAL